jgi:hypothetical protein
MFEEYVKMVVWNKEAKNGKGNKKGHLIQLEREDLNKQYIWFKISENGNIIRITTCYFAPHFQKLTKVGGLITKTPLQP